MKKKIVSLVLAMVLVLAYAVPVAATETDAAAAPNTASETVSEDPAVQDAYDTYKAVESALASYDYAALKPAHEKMANVSFDTDAQQEEFDNLVYDQIGVDTYLVTVFTAAYVVDAGDKYEAFAADKNAKTAFDFVAAYDAATDDYEVVMESFIPGITAAYDEAKSYLPTDNVVKVYEAYIGLTEALEMLEAGWYDEDFVNACKAFEDVLDIFNELTEDEFAQLAVMMEVADGDEAFGVILSDWINANLALELGALQDAYLNNMTVKTATELIEGYEEILNDTQLLTDADKKVILTAFEDAYNDAKNFLAQAGDDKATTDGSDKSDKDTSPATGDDFNAAPFAVLMVIAAAVAALAVRRRKIE